MSSPKPLHFFTLPLELRIKVYQHVIADLPSSIGVLASHPQIADELVNECTADAFATIFELVGAYWSNESLLLKLLTNPESDVSCR